MREFCRFLPQFGRKDFGEICLAYKTGDLSLGSQRTQAAQAMQAHSRHAHYMGLLLELLPNKHEVLASAAVSRHLWILDR